MLTILRMKWALQERLKREDGQTIVEYGLVVGGISLFLIGVFAVTGLGGIFDELVDAIDEAMAGEVGPEPPA